jgi:hypothetical protein
MSKKQDPKDPFTAISSDDLNKVAGGAARVTARSGAATDQLTQMLTQITSSIKDLASAKPAGMDPMMMMMMMMMGGGGGGGAAAAPPPTAAPTPPTINISTNVRRGGGCGG